MSKPKRTSVYLEPSLHEALRRKAVETKRSLSDLVNSAVRSSLAEDADDLAAFEERADEPTLDFEAVVKDRKPRAGWEDAARLLHERGEDGLREDADDLAAFEERAAEPSMDSEAVIKDLKRRGKL